MSSPHLFTPLKLRGLEIRNRIFVSPYWPLHAAHALGAETPWPKQYERARPR
ncbi:MAG: hypothetical protein P8014_00360 [Acidihalobacter sp.]|uniref:hypothetical protein n=1 Tax=Acidihalobacter sp. TaxID=1872108 RepID=UPI00307E3016